jgi:ATP-dependent Clp protease protease subunit
MGRHTGHSWKELEDYFLRDRFLNAEEARAYGLVDEILGDSSDVVHLDYSELIISTRGQLQI